MKKLTPNISLKSLESFRAIVETGSATAAADKIGMTQPGISRLLAQLEKRLGFALFFRDKGRLILTQEARVLYPEIDQALDNLGRIAALAKNLNNFEVGHLNVVTPPSLMEGSLANLVAQYLDLYPHIRVTLEACRAETVKEMVLRRAADCGIVKLPANTAGLSSELLFESGSCCLLDRRHPLAQSDSISVDQLNGEPLVLLGKGSPFRATLEKLFRDASVPMRVRVDVHTVGSACAFAKLGVGIAIVNGALASHYVDKSLVSRPLSPGIEHQYGFIYSSHVLMSRATQAFLALCKEFFKH